MNALNQILGQINQDPSRIDALLASMSREDQIATLALLEAAEGRTSRNAAQEDFGTFCERVMPGFQRPLHIQIIIDALERVERGELKRLILALPPRHGKSETTSKLFLAWYMGRNANREVAFATYNQEYANQRGRAVRDLMASSEYQEIFPDAAVKMHTSAAQRFETANKNQFFAVGVGGPLTGRGAHLAVIDDPIKNREEADSPNERARLIAWYQSAFRTRLYPGGAIILIATRWHLADLTGYVLSENEHENWEVLEFPAILDEPASQLLGRPIGTALWPERYNLDELHQIRTSVGTREWTALYQQKPVPNGGGVIERDWLRWWGSDKPPECSTIIASWDTAYGQTRTSDFSAVTVWGTFQHEDIEGNSVPCAILLGARRGRWKFGDLKAQMIEIDRKFGCDFTLVESKGPGLSTIQELRSLGLPMKEYVPRGSKEHRLDAVSPFFEQGRIYIPKGKEWADDYIEQLCNFPASRYDDYVDATSQALRTIRLGGGITTTLDVEPMRRSGGVKGYW